MLQDISRYSLLLMLFTRIVEGSPVAQTSAEVTRQEKSAEILKYMNTSVDPCDDFFEFTCGNYGKYNSITSNSISEIDLFIKLKMARDVKMQTELETHHDDDTLADKKVKTFYKSCLNMAEISEEYRKKLKELVAKFGHMPVLEGDEWQERDFDWANVVGELNYKLDLPVIIDIEIIADLNDNTIKRVALSHVDLFLGHKTAYVDEMFADDRLAYLNGLATSLMLFLGVERNLASKTAKEMLDFETALAQGLTDLSTVKSLSDITSLIAIDEMQSKYLSTWDTKKLLSTALGFIPSHVVIVPQYLDNVFAVVKNTPRKVIANYVFMSYLLKFMPPIPETPTQRQEKCVETTKQYFHKNLYNMLYRKYFTKDSEEVLSFMWQQMKSSFEDVLQSPSNSWIKEETVKQALKKLEATTMYIESFGEIDFDQQLAHAILDEDDFAGNIYAAMTIRGDEGRAKIIEPPKTEVPDIESITPTYVSVENVVRIPFAFVQPNYVWSVAYPSVYNFASFGFTLAHEIVHGFDDSGRTFDAKGNNIEWWDFDSIREFDERAKCFTNQYKNYIYGGRHLPEMTAQGENIADNGGLSVSYEAYLKWHEKASKKSLEMESLPGLNYTNRQMFFISLGHAWCNVVDPETLAKQAAMDVHTPNKFRIIGILSNFEEFSKEFNCPRGSAMNPVEKCKIY